MTAVWGRMARARPFALGLLLVACADPPASGTPAAPISAVPPAAPIEPAAADGAWSLPGVGGLWSSDAAGVVTLSLEGGAVRLEHVTWGGERRVLLHRRTLDVDPETRHAYVYDAGADIVFARSSRQMLDGPAPDQDVWLRGLAPGTGEERWRTRVPDAALLRVGEDAVLISQRFEVAAVRRADGVLRWRTSVPFLDGWNTGFRVAAVGGRLLVGAGRRLVALDERSGALLWTREIDADRMSAEEDTVVAIEPAVALHLIDVETGKTRRRIPWEDRTGALLLDRGTLFAAREDRSVDPGGVAAYDAATGTLLWEHADATLHWRGPILADEHLVHARMDRSGKGPIGLVGYDRKTGEERWTVDLPGLRAFALEPEGRRVLATNHLGSLYAWARPTPPDEDEP